jgi:bifunctional UDP-N-acetylglucosamine pyrophosphorylase/glucosamine-1-phosphate N-acetyltransferase
LQPLKKGTLLRIVTARAPEPQGYGRVVRKAGRILRIVEEKDATAKQRALHEVNVSIYVIDSEFLSVTLPRLGTQNAQKEYYLTDVLAIAARKPRAVEDFLWERFEDLTGINDPWELARVNRLARDRILERHARSGVRFADPLSTWIDSTVELAEDVEVGPGVILQGKTRIGCRSQIGAYSVLKDVVVGENVKLRVGVVAENAQIERGATLGPYAHLRPESYVGEEAKIGNFVELKKTRVGPQTSIAHLSYLGDAEVGARVNIGCGFVTCNFDGREIAGSRKHRTVIEDDVFMGSDCQTVAPVRVGRGAFVASGSTITREVEPDALAIARAHQVNKPGYGKRLRTPRK